MEKISKRKVLINAGVIVVILGIGYTGYKQYQSGVQLEKELQEIKVIEKDYNKAKETKIKQEQEIEEIKKVEEELVKVKDDIKVSQQKLETAKTELEKTKVSLENSNKYEYTDTFKEMDIETQKKWLNEWIISLKAGSNAVEYHNKGADAEAYEQEVERMKEVADTIDRDNRGVHTSSDLKERYEVKLNEERAKVLAKISKQRGF